MKIKHRKHSQCHGMASGRVTNRGGGTKLRMRDANRNTLAKRTLKRNLLYECASYIPFFFFFLLPTLVIANAWKI